MPQDAKILYIAEVIAEGGRNGHARSSDGQFDLALAVPAELGSAGGTGTNPEQLFAAGYAACFLSALFNVAAGRKLDLAGCRLTARVRLGPTGRGGFGLSVVLDLHAPQLDPTDAAVVLRRAHDICPYSNATRGNVDVTLLFAGAPLEPGAEQAPGMP